MERLPGPSWVYGGLALLVATVASFFGAISVVALAAAATFILSVTVKRFGRTAPSATLSRYWPAILAIMGVALSVLPGIAR